MDAVMGQGTCGIRDYHRTHPDLFDTFVFYDIDGAILLENLNAFP